MNSRLLVNGLLGCLIGTSPVTVPVALHAAGPPGITSAADATAENADDTSNPYSVIVERNIFHLNPPPPPEPEKPKVDVPVVKISGFVTIGHKRTVLFVSQPKDKKGGPLYYSLIVGETSSDGQLELAKIHPAEDAVDVINAGVPVTLTVSDDSFASSPLANAPPPQNDTPPGFNPGGRLPGRRIFPNRNFPPGVQNGNGFAFPAQARRNLPQ